MSEQISDFLNVSKMENGQAFSTDTICGPVDLCEHHGTSKCFRITVNRIAEEPTEIIMPKHQALSVACQIASQFGCQIMMPVKYE